MTERKFQQVRQLTERIAEFVEAFNIEGCKLLLEQRLVLLKQIQLELADQPNNKELADEFVELLKWIEVKDEQPQQKTLDFKNRYKDKLSKQKKINVAIKQYTSI